MGQNYSTDIGEECRCLLGWKLIHDLRTVFGPFMAGPKITDPRLFVGRNEELHTIASRLTGEQPVSVNIVGRRRIGKSSLLYHFFQTYEQRVPEPTDRQKLS